MDVTLGRIMPVGVTDYAGKLADLQNNLASPSQNLGLNNTLGAGALGTQSIGLDGAQAVNPAGKGVMESFSHLLSQALGDVNQLHLNADADAQKLVSGDQVDVHQVMIGMEKANVAFGLTVQVRNKLIEAYQEVMRMQV
jgi:flagellar hook-basal body complex protein FliE